MHLRCKAVRAVVQRLPVLPVLGCSRAPLSGFDFSGLYLLALISGSVPPICSAISLRLLFTKGHGAETLLVAIKRQRALTQT